MNIYKIYSKDNDNYCSYIGANSLKEVKNIYVNNNKNSLSNIINIDTIEIGTGATQIVGSDFYPFTIIEIINDKKIVVQSDDAKPDVENGFDYFTNQIYKITPNPNGKVLTLSLRKNNLWVEVGKASKNPATFFSLGNRIALQNPSF